MPEEQSLWEGSCFIFDNRLALNSSLEKLEEGVIDSEWKHKKRQEFIERNGLSP